MANVSRFVSRIWVLIAGHSWSAGPGLWARLGRVNLHVDAAGANDGHRSPMSREFVGAATKDRRRVYSRPVHDTDSGRRAAKLPPGWSAVMRLLSVGKASFKVRRGEAAHRTRSLFGRYFGGLSRLVGDLMIRRSSASQPPRFEGPNRASAVCRRCRLQWAFR